MKALYVCKTGGKNSMLSSSKKYVYLLIFTSFLLMFFSSSVKNVFQVWFIDICTSFGVSRSEFSLSGVTFMMITGVGSWVAGLLSDRLGVRKTILLGNILISFSFIASALVVNFYAFVAIYGGLSAFALAAVQYVPMGVLVEETFRGSKHKGLIYALLINGTALGFVILSPLWVFLNLTISWQEVYLALGLFFLVILTPMLFFALPVNQSSNAQTSSEKSFNAMSWQKTLSNPAFWFISLSFFGCGVNMAFIDVHFVPMMQDQSTATAVVGISLSILGVMEMLGGFVAGWLTDRMKPAVLLSGFYSLRALSGWLLMQSTDETSLIIFSSLFGATYLGTVIVTSLFTLQYFGKENKGAVFGLVFFIHQIGASLSTWMGAHIFDSTGSYHYAVMLATAFSIASAIIALALFNVNKRPLEA
ncbi:MAG: MFS transporter [Hyphomicrobiales bacterium]|nr:MFS transporter [Hyphomicrobiales bacterium]MCY4048020.1 MFS transporter [Hyphomicrobiales bacterium]MCY4052284.1 MFS transporter [Hyphomicrobiales bacterium]